MGVVCLREFFTELHPSRHDVHRHACYIGPNLAGVNARGSADRCRSKAGSRSRTVYDAPSVGPMTAERTPFAVLMTALGMEYAPADVEQRAVELHLQRSDLAWTILRPNWFFQNLTDGPLRALADAHDGLLRLPTSDAAVSFIDTRDIKEHRANRFCHRFYFLPGGTGKGAAKPIGRQTTIDDAREQDHAPVLALLIEAPHQVFVEQCTGVGLGGPHPIRQALPF